MSVPQKTPEKRDHMSVELGWLKATAEGRFAIVVLAALVVTIFVAAALYGVSWI